MPRRNLDRQDLTPFQRMSHLLTPNRVDHIVSEEQSSRIVASDDHRLREHIETDIRSISPFTITELVDVVFNETANTDTVIRHSLNTVQPEQIKWMIVGIELSSVATVPIIYRDASTMRRKWEDDYIILRSNIASLKATLLLGVPR